MTAAVDTRGDYERVFDVYWPIGLGVMVVVWVALMVLAIRYRRRPGDTAWPEQTHDLPKAEVTYVALLAVVAAFLVFLTFTTMSGSSADVPDEAQPPGQVDGARSAAARPAVAIDVTAARWNWRFDYRELGITQVGDGRQIPTLVVPVGDVRFSVTSIDVIHSFFIPYLRFKRDAFPGRRNVFVLGFDEPGFHRAEGECAEFCGLRHAYMHFNVRVLAPDAFRGWVRARQDGRPQERTPGLNDEGEWK